MQKLTGISSGKNNKSCRIIHPESNKIGFAFFWFFMIFYAIYKKQQNHYTIGVTLSQLGPWKVFLLCNVVPGAAGRRGRLDSGDRRRRDRSGTGREGSMGRYGLVWALGWWGEAAGGRRTGSRRWRPPRPVLRRGRASPGLGRDATGWREERGGTRARRADRPPFILSSLTVPQGTDRRSSERADHGTTSQGRARRGTAS
jgi:hypothetical protein